MAISIRSLSMPRPHPARRWLIRALATLVTLAVIVELGVLIFNYRLNSRLDSAEQHASAVQQQLNDDNALQSLDAAGLARLDGQLSQLQSDLRDLDAQLNLPVVGSIARNAPVISHRVKAAQDLL